MDIEFDPAKDATNIEKHGISLARFVDMDVAGIVEDDRFDEPRLRIYGEIDGIWHCAAVTIRATVFRVISLRRAHAKEIRRHV
ncbi:MAG TPA: BrnT family toxin [Sphingobium sp.]|nr:BrnT family toxin [Sphingobium sp.]